MINLIRLYNQNRKSFFIIIIIIVAIIILLQLLNFLTKRNSKKQEDEIIVSNEHGKNYEAITGEEKDDATYQREKNVIENFLDNCVNGTPETAYDMISEECKIALYPTVEDFINQYYNNNFKDNKISYNYQAWSDETYKIELRKNMLSTGIYSDSIYKEDYYTIKGMKLNISGYIKKEQKNEEGNILNETINIKINSLEYYKNYLICNIEVFNKTDKNILLDSLDNSKDIVLTDKNNVEFKFYNDELNLSELILYSGELKRISLKFNIAYRSDLDIKEIAFRNIITDYEKFKNNELDGNDIRNVEIKI